MRTQICSECPFRADRPGFLGGVRARHIADDLRDDQTHFRCHKTVQYDEEGIVTGGPDCAGAQIVLWKEQQPNIRMRLAAMSGQGVSPEAAQADATCVDSLAGFVQHHGGNEA